MNQQEEQQDNSRQTLYNSEFPKISSYSERRSSNVPNDIKNIYNLNTNSSNNNKGNPATKQDKVQEVAPYNVIQTMITRLGHIHAAQFPTVVLRTTLKQTTKQRQPSVIFDMYDHMHTLTVECKHTFVWTLSTTMRKVELIRKIFIQETQ